MAVGSEESITAIREMVDAFQEAVRAEDWAAASQAYSGDAVIMPPNQGLVEGRAGWLAWVSAMEFSVTEYSIEIRDIDARGDLAFVRGTFDEVLTVGGFPDPITDSGKFIQIWRQQAGGSWQITVDIYNSNVPLPEAEG
jgi:ketosteroid isomerase-like protein